jgi:transposase-like protein
MLKSFQLNEYSSLKDVVQDEKIAQIERSLAKDFVLSQMSFHIEEFECPICHSDEHTNFFVKWGIKYLRCRHCGSIYAVCSKSFVKAYKEDSAIRDFRISKEYQDDAERMRHTNWVEFLDWLKFRFFRFNGARSNLVITDFGNRYKGFANLVIADKMFRKYQLVDSALETDYNVKQSDVEAADIIIFANRIQQSFDPVADLAALKPILKNDGIIILQSRLGSGFDILTLKGQNDKIFPFEHILLPSKEALFTILDEAGYEILEVTTPGNLDVNYVYSKKDCLLDDNIFTKYMFEHSSPETLREFQRFLQKNDLSSFVQVIARKK